MTQIVERVGLTVLVCWAAGSSLVAPAAAQRLAVVSRAESVVAFIDLTSQRITSVVPVGPASHEIASDEKGRFAYVAAYGGDTVTRIDLQSEKVVYTIATGMEGGLHGITVSDSTVWVTAEEERAILEMDAESGAVRRSWKTNAYRSHMVVSIPEYGKLYVANIDSGSVSVVDARHESLTIISTGAGTEGIDRSPDGNQVWVSNRVDNTISVIDTRSDIVVAHFSSAGVFPVKLRFRPDGAEVWVSNNNSGDIAVFDAETFALKASIPVGERPLGLAFSADNRFGYVTRPGADEVVEIDIRNEYRIHRRIAAPPSPDGVLWLRKQSED